MTKVQGTEPKTPIPTSDPKPAPPVDAPETAPPDEKVGAGNYWVLMISEGDRYVAQV